MSARQPHDLLAAVEPESSIAKLIPIGTSTVGAAFVQTTNARDLHAFLEIGKDFSSWVKAQIARARLVENRDYTCSPSRVSSSSGTKHAIEYHLTLDAGKHVGMLSETERGFEVREYYIDCERRALAPARVLSPAEMFLQNAQAMVDMERRQLAQEEKIDRVEQRVDELADTMVLRTRPAGSESITHMRPRAAKMFGLPERIVEYVVRQSPMAIKPACMVRNEREEAEGGSFAVYWVKDVNTVLRRFAAECRMATANFATHPYVDGRFKLTPPTPGGG